jgi:hypothetical protein
VEFTPYGEPQARVYVGRRTREIAVVDLDDLIRVVDETDKALRARRSFGGC